MRILGVDPGLISTGWGVLVYKNNCFTHINSGCICPPRHYSLGQRLGFLYDHLKKKIYDHRPEEAAVEEVFVNTNYKGSLKLGHARGALLACIDSFSIPTAEYATCLIKQSVVGSGQAHKKQIIKMVSILLTHHNTNTLSEDAADALAVAICHAHHCLVKKE